MNKQDKQEIQPVEDTQTPFSKQDEQILAALPVLREEYKKLLGDVSNLDSLRIERDTILKQVSDMDIQIREKKESIKNFDSELKGIIKKNTQVRELKIADLEKKDQKLNKQMGKFEEEKREFYKKFDNQVKLADEKLEEAKEKEIGVAQEKENIAKIQLEIDQKNKDLTIREQKIKNQEEYSSKSADEVSERLEKAIELEKTNKDKEKELKVKINGIEDREKNIEESSASIAGRSKSLEEQKAEIDNKEKDLNERTTVLEIQEKKNEESIKKIEEGEKTNQQRAEEIEVEKLAVKVREQNIYKKLEKANLEEELK